MKTIIIILVKRRINRRQVFKDVIVMSKAFKISVTYDEVTNREEDQESAQDRMRRTVY
jgi:hypothetical protein